MAKKKSTFSKLLALTTTAAAIGGTCYIFRDKIKQSGIYKTAHDKFSDIFGKVSDQFCDDDTEDFFFDNEDDDFKDVFSENTEHGREYTSITINSKDAENSEDSEHSANKEDSKDTEYSVDKEDSENTEHSADKEDSKDTEHSADTKDSEDIKNSSDEEEKNTASKASSDEELIEIFPKNSISSIPVSDTSSAKATDYENSGLSDTSEDPDSL